MLVAKVTPVNYFRKLDGSIKKIDEEKSKHFEKDQITIGINQGKKNYKNFINGVILS